MNLLTKDGLTGNSGLGVANLSLLFHVSTNYAAGKKTCFVETCDDPHNVPSWERMDLAQAKKQARKIISCSYCRRPAISLDHFWPYYTEANHCAHHRDWRKLAGQAT